LADEVAEKRFSSDDMQIMVNIIQNRDAVKNYVLNDVDDSHEGCIAIHEIVRAFIEKFVYQSCLPEQQSHDAALNAVSCFFEAVYYASKTSTYRKIGNKINQAVASMYMHGGHFKKEKQEKLL